MSTNAQDPQDSPGPTGKGGKPGADETAEEPTENAVEAPSPEPADDDEDWADTATVQMEAIPDPDAKD